MNQPAAKKTPLKKIVFIILCSFVILVCICILGIGNASKTKSTPSSTPAALPSEISSPTSLQTPTIILTPTAKSIIPTDIPQLDSFSWKNIASREDRGLLFEITYLLLAEKSAARNIPIYPVFNSFSDDPVVGIIVFRISNNSQNILTLYPDQGTIVIGNEQIDLSPFFDTFGDDLSGDIHPGVVKIGGIWFGIKRNPLAEIQSLTLTISAPHDENFNNIGEDYHFVLDLSERKNEPLPDELK